MYFYNLNLGPHGAEQSWTLGPSFEQTWYKDHYAMLPTNFQASKSSGSEKEDFWIFFLFFFLWLEPRTPGQKPSWILWPTFEQSW